jgi:2-polyprenyl-3-methyl-5-hydroxy-6-metoxy-1,4-benzoquinol methylase
MMLSRLPAAVKSSPAARVKWEDAACPLCGLDAAPVVREAPDPNRPDGLVFAVVRCPQCRLHYTNPRPDELSIGRFYPDDYRPHRKSRKASRPPDRSLFTWITGSDCPERRGVLPRREPGRLLDFGCGGGSFLERMRDLGWDVTGVDASPATVRMLRDDLRLRAIEGSLPHAELRPGSFDCVTMWHSLEHVHEPLAVLRSAFRLLAPGGHVVVAVPNIDSWPAKGFGGEWFGLDLPRHLTHFDPASLRSMLGLAGFRVDSVRLVKHSDWMRSSALLAIRRGKAGLASRLMAWKPLAKLAAWLTWCCGRCDCVLAVAHRPD